MTKRLRKTVRLFAAWMCVCLMLVDPAAACRLLAGRRCCCPCPTPCSDVAATTTETNTASSAPAPVVSSDPGAAHPPVAPIVDPTQDSAGIAAAPQATPTTANDALPASEASAAIEVVRPPALVDQPAQESAPAAPAPAAASVQSHEQPPTPTESAAAESAPQLTGRDTPAQDLKEESQRAAPPRADNVPVTPTTPANESPKQLAPDADDPFAPLPPKKALEQKGAAARPTKSTPDPANSAERNEEVSRIWRQWTDNSGQFRVKARFLAVLDGKVRLLKESGRTTTVSMERLSAADRTYVFEVVARYGQDLVQNAQVAHLDTNLNSP